MPARPLLLSPSRDVVRNHVDIVVNRRCTTVSVISENTSSYSEVRFLGNPAKIAIG